MLRIFGRTTFEIQFISSLVMPQIIRVADFREISIPYCSTFHAAILSFKINRL
jgi:hypothetical protein